MRRPNDLSLEPPESGERLLASLEERLLDGLALLNRRVEPWLSSAVKEAKAIALKTGFPLLVFPVLLEEKVISARRLAEIQAANRYYGVLSVETG